MTHPLPMPVCLRTLRFAFPLVLMAGCEPPSEGGSTEGASRSSGADSIQQDAEDTGMDTAASHAAVAIPSALRDELASGGVTQVIVEMRSIDMPGLARAKGGERAQMLNRRAEQYASTRDIILSGLSSDARLDRSFDHVPLMIVEVSSDVALERLALDRSVVGLHANERFEPVMDQSLQLINQPEAAAEGHTGAGTAVAILDTGLDYRHSDFGSCTDVGEPADCRVVAAADFAPQDNKLDTNGHGTNVAAIVGGVAPGTDLIGLDVFRSNGYAYTSEIVAAIDWVIENQDIYNIVALNMSLGGGSYTAECAGTSYDIAMMAALEAGVASAVATGNNGWTNRIGSPACAPSAVKVGAVYDDNYGRIGWSGCTDTSTAADKVTCFSNSASFVDLLAPGALIDAGGYRMGGTSQATPHVAGALAVMAAAYPKETPEEWTERLIETGITLTDHRNGLSFPRIDVEAAVADAHACYVSLDASQIEVPVSGGSGLVSVDVESSCDWDVSSEDAWLSFSPASGTGAGTITWTAAANPDGARVGSVSVGSDAVVFSQGANAAPVAAVTIDAGVSYTASRTLQLSISASDADDAVTGMCIANIDEDPDAACSSWETYSTARTWWSSAGQGTKQVGVWVRDSRGRVSEVAPDAIVLDTVAPTGSSLSAIGINGGGVLTWSAATEAGVGLERYWVQSASGTTAPSSCSSGTQVYEGAGLTTTITGLSNGQAYAFRLCATDALGNEGSLATATVTPAEASGDAGTLSINGGTYWTDNRVVQLTMSAGIENATHMCVSDSSSCETWISAQDELEWTMPNIQGAHTVHLWYRNSIGQESPPVTAAVGLDTIDPSEGSLTVESSSRRAELAWSGQEDFGSGVESVVVVMEPGLKAPRTCEKGEEVYRGSAQSAVLTGLVNGQNYTIRLCTIDVAGNQSSGTTAVLGPVGGGPRGSIVLNNGDIWTAKRAVNVSIDSTSATEMCISHTTRCSRWQPVRSQQIYMIPSRQGEAVVYATFRDGDGDLSPVVSDAIQLDNGAPGDQDLTVVKGDRQLEASWSSSSDKGSGVDHYIIVANEGSTEAPNSCSAGTLLWEGETASATLTGLTNGQPYALRKCSVDVAGNMSSGATAVGWPGTDETAPVGSMVLNGNDGWTRLRSVAVTLSASDDASGVRDVCVSTRTTECTTWTALSDDLVVNLSSKQGLQTVYGWIRDNEGNVSEMISDDIGFDSRAPKGGVVTAAEGNASTRLSWADFAETGSGLDWYRVIYTTDTGVRNCSKGTVAYEGSRTSTTVTGLQNGETYTFAVCPVDVAGNVGKAATNSQRPASEYDAPTGSVVVEGGAAYAGTGMAAVAITASDASGVARMCVSTSRGCSRFVPFASNAVVNMPGRTKSVTVSVWLEDGQGNRSQTPLTDVIEVDGTAPTNGTATAKAISRGVQFTASGAVDAHSGVAGYVVAGRVGGGKAPKCGTSSDLATAAGPTFSVTGLKRGSAYTFRVCAVDAVGNMSKGVQVYATPK